jgi:beta-lactam-binding protein with PASTA domain
MKKAEVAKYLVSKEFYKNLGIAIVVSILLLIIVFSSLRIYTHHGESFSVPDLRGLTLEEVEETMESYELRIQVTDSVYLQNFEPGTVVEQLPAANFKVKENRKVFLTLNASTPEMVNMPKVVDESLRQAEAILESNGLTLGKLIYRPHIAKNYVLEQQYNGEEITPGQSVPRNSIIDLVLGGGLGDKQSDVPNLINMYWETAKDLTKSRYLNLGEPIFDNSVLTKDDSTNARIFMQKPVPKLSAKMASGGFVDVWLTVDSIKLQEALIQIEENYYDP